MRCADDPVTRSGGPAIGSQRPVQHHAHGLAQQVGRAPVECERQL
jgi:hypothetical protein